MNKKEYILYALKWVEWVDEFTDSLFSIIKKLDNNTKFIDIFFYFVKSSIENKNTDQFINISNKNKEILNRMINEEKENEKKELETIENELNNL